MFEVFVCDVDQWQMNHYWGLGIFLILENVDLLLRLLFQTGKISIWKGELMVFTVGSSLL